MTKTKGFLSKGTFSLLYAQEETPNKRQSFFYYFEEIVKTQKGKKTIQPTEKGFFAMSKFVKNNPFQKVTRRFDDTFNVDL